MNPGELKHRIEFGRFKIVTDSKGFKSKIWVSSFNMWAAVKNLYGSEFWAAKAVQGESTIKFKCRYNTEITSDLYIKFKDNYYEIIAPPDNIGYLNKELEIKAKLLEKDKLQ